MEREPDLRRQAPKKWDRARHAPAWFSFYDPERLPTRRLDPEIERRLDREDPRRTARALAAAGYAIRWSFIDRNPKGGPPKRRAITDPPSDSRLFLISAPQPASGARELLLTVTPKGESGVGSMLPPGGLADQPEA